jgi:major membrane immunogen (membrane-anchored lipoprotein)
MLNSHYINDSAILYKNFLEICCTIYHEIRHAEQIYRIAQGLASGQLRDPDASSAKELKLMQGENLSVQSRIAMFEAVIAGQNPLQTNLVASATEIADRLKIPEHVAKHAISHRDYFTNYLNAPRPRWFKRGTVLDEINEWMRASYQGEYKNFDQSVQVKHAGMEAIYRDLPEENDAYGIEDDVREAILQRIGSRAYLNTPRNNIQVFGP